jgi:arylformamidase
MLRDISVLVRSGTPEWPGDTPYECGWGWRISAGASVNVSVIRMSPHVGTHADAPLHVRDGAPGSEAFDLPAFMGEAWVSGAEGAGMLITPDMLIPRLGPERVERLLLRTGQSIADGSFPDEWPVLAPETVDALLARGLRLLGVDAPSVDQRDSQTLDNHHRLFDGGASIVENLDLRGVEDGMFELIALPLRIDALDAAPVRALLRPR